MLNWFNRKPSLVPLSFLFPEQAQALVNQKEKQHQKNTILSENVL